MIGKAYNVFMDSGYSSIIIWESRGETMYIFSEGNWERPYIQLKSCFLKGFVKKNRALKLQLLSKW